MDRPQSPSSQPAPRTDRYAFAGAGRAMTASQVRALFAVAARPEVVSLAGGMPDLAALPIDAIAAMAGQLLREHGTAALQYGSAQGEIALREQTCHVMRREGIEARAEDVVVTAGSQQALDLVSKIFLDPGDVVLAEGPSYVGALAVFASYQADVVHVEMDDDGLVPDSLRASIGRLRAAGRRIKLLYTIPNFHNPAGVTMAPCRRSEILEICRAAGILVLEDNP